MRTFAQGSDHIEVLKGVDIAVEPGQFVALLGPSGAGKSTLLHIAGLLEYANDGDVIIDGNDCGQLTERERTKVRGNSLGLVYQHHHLLPEFSALENVMMPQLLAKHDSYIYFY